MKPGEERTNRRLAAGACAIGAACLLAALFGSLWVLAAVPIGLLFGFFLQKGNLCGAAGCSEVLLFRSWEKLRGLWVCMVSSMAGFALLDALGWVILAPKPFRWMNLLAGGVLFGSGMVLAGGCVTGTLFKAGAGSFTSAAALAGIPIGVGLVRHGPIHSLYDRMGRFVIHAPGGGTATLPALTGLSYQILALLFAAATLAGWAVLVRRRRPPPFPPGGDSRRPFFWTRPSWKPWQAGLAIGILAAPAYLCSAAAGLNYPLGTTGGVYSTVLLVTERRVEHVWRARKPDPQPAARGLPADPSAKGPIPAAREGAAAATPDRAGPAAGENPAAAMPPGGRTGPGAAEDEARAAAARRPKRVYWWLVLLCAGLVAGSWLAARLSGAPRWLPKPKGQTAWAFAGGLLVGTGAALADGCFYGNIVSGGALMSLGAYFFAAVVVPAAWAATWFYLVGGGIPRRRF